ncbi:hypothetical protein [Muricoccus radiodurans]|uniref:hypothetical protein n=1 Tax=Muricoccus radiodurans TaxID=2231721 RepID=UPI003CF3E5D5
MPESREKTEERGPGKITPFADEATLVSVGDLTVENRTDRVSIYGSLDITRDRKGLRAARHLQTLLTAAISVMEGEGDRLPESVDKGVSAERVPNPFG